MKGLYCFLLLYIITLCHASGKKIQVKKTLSFSSKIPLKSIKSPDGDIIDCIHISRQPACDQPLFRNHTIVMSPSYYPGKGAFGESEIFNFKAHSQNDTEAITQLWQLNGRCLEGAIPIRRNQNTSNIKRYPTKKHRSVPNDDRANHEHSFAYVAGKKYFGTKASINVWQPHVQNHNEFSLSQLWIVGGPYSIVDTIEAGWMVYPGLFGDSQARLFIYWTKDNYQSAGCYNLMCPGFVQISNTIALGGTIYPISSYNGEQYDVKLHIWKDTTQHVWWLLFEDRYLNGYWPASLFTYLADSAYLIEWGGEVINDKVGGQHTATQMGSGHFAEEKFGRSSFFRNLQVVDESSTLTPPEDIMTITERPNCNDIALAKNDHFGDFFYYEGPGKNDNCP